MLKQPSFSLTVWTITVIVCTVPLLIGWESALLLMLPGGIPLGTLMAAIAIFSAAKLTSVTARAKTLLSYISALLCLFALFWLPLGAVLSGKMSLNFYQNAASSEFFWRYTNMIVVAILGALLWTLIDTFLDRKIKK